MRKETRVKERLLAASSVDDLAELLSELARDPKQRWTRSQVLFYLDPDLHRAADPWFDGEQIVRPRRALPTLPLVDPTDLEEILDQLTISSEPEESRFASPRISPPRLEDLRYAPPQGETDILGNVIEALVEEARTIERDSPKRFRLRDGRCVGPQGDQFVYVFTWSSEPDLFIPGELRIRNAKMQARVGRQSDGAKEFELLVDTFIGLNVKRAIFEIDPTFVIRAECEALNGYRSAWTPGTGLPGKLFQPPTPIHLTGSASTASSLNERQREAVATARAAEVGYVWGPPGTGKTTSLGHLIADLAEAGKRVLVVSPYNVAVNEAVLSVSRRKEWAKGTVVRLGRVSDEVRKSGLDLDSLLEYRAASSGLLEDARKLHRSVTDFYKLKSQIPPATVRRCIEELGEIVMRMEKHRAVEAKRILKAIRSLRNRFRAPESEIITQASVVGTTVALSFLSPLVHARRFDHIVVDEASVVRTPEALLIALMAGPSCKLTFFGDPKQLPPVVVTNSPNIDRWVRPTPFTLAGISKPADAVGTCVILNEQHRMATPIRTLVSELFYDGSLRDARPRPDGRIIFLDTTRTPAKATPRWIRMSRSKENVVHRGITASLLRAIRQRHEDSSILVLSPFRAQKDAYKAEPATNRIPNVRFETVHTSQGSESDVVVIDLVVAPGRGRSRFMDEHSTPEFRNLMNVAMSRARDQLIFIGHRAQIERQYPNGLLEEIIERVEADHEILVVPRDLRLNALWRETMVLRE